MQSRSRAQIPQVPMPESVLASYHSQVTRWTWCLTLCSHPVPLAGRPRPWCHRETAAASCDGGVSLSTYRHGNGKLRPRSRHVDA